METAVEYCPNCGQTFEPAFGGAGCPHCAAQPQAISGQAVWPAPVQEAAATAPPEAVSWGAGMGVLTWLISIALMVGTQIIAAIVYIAVRVFQSGGVPKGVQIDWLLAMLSVASAFPAHLLTLAF